MPEQDIIWCIVHGSVVVTPDDGDHVFLCEKASRDADRTPCSPVEAEVRWPRA